VKKNEMTSRDRRRFLCAVPAAAAAGLSIANVLPLLASAQSETPGAIPESGFELYSAKDISSDIQELEAKAVPATSKRLVNDKNFLLDLWVEKKNAGKEYEWHEHRDHVVQILDGETSYEVGGKPTGAHSTGPGEWLSPTAEGVTKMTLKKGDVLVIRRGTLHKRTTDVGVTFTLTAPVTPVSG
jgi:hypothetical protein